MSSTLPAYGNVQPTSGFVYAPCSDGEPLLDAAPGDVIRIEGSGPPWIVVNHAIESILVTGWPGRLCRVAVLEPAAHQPGVGYTRAAAVTLEFEVPLGRLFGPHGDEVLRIIDQAASLGLDEVHSLAALTSKQASTAYLRAWNAWLENQHTTSSHAGADDSATPVASSGARSPVGAAFTIISSLLSERARDLVGDAAFVLDEEDGVYVLIDSWAGASSALCCAAMAVGAPHLITASDKRLLERAWRDVFASR